MEGLIAVTVAVIGAVATITAAWFGRSTGTKRGRASERESLEQQAQDSAASLQIAQTDRIGLTAERVKSHMVVTSDDGDAKTRRTWEGLQATKGHSVSQIPGRFFTVTPGASISAQVRLYEINSSKQLSLQIDPSSSTECQYVIDIFGSLTDADAPIGFTEAVEYQRKVLMSEAAVQEAYVTDRFKHDYFCFDVSIPVRTLELEVAFPSRKPPHFSPMVFWGHSEHEHVKELARTRSGFEATPNGARFTVNDPFLGFRYAIFWCFDPDQHGGGRQIWAAPHRSRAASRD